MDRAQLKREAKDILWNAKVSPLLFALIYLAVTAALDGVSTYTSGAVVRYMQEYFPQTPVPPFLLRALTLPPAVVFFVAIMSKALSWVLSAGSALYHLGIRQGREMPYGTLLDGFASVGRVVLLMLLEGIFIFLWTMLFIIPGIIAAYRYRFALYNLLEIPELTPMEAISMSKAQTDGYKEALFLLDLSFIGWGLLSALTLNILDIWVLPYRTQTDVGYFQTVKRVKGIGYLPEQERQQPPAPDPLY